MDSVLFAISESQALTFVPWNPWLETNKKEIQS